MNKSDTLGKLATALNAAQKEMEPALKDAANPFFKSKYADLTSVWKAASGPLGNHGLSVSQMNRIAEPFPYQDVDKNGQVFTSVMLGVIVETVLLHSSGEWISGEAYAPLNKNDAQGVGSAITYLRRYGLAAILGIVAEDDDGNNASGNRPQYQEKKTDNVTPKPESQQAAEHFAKKPDTPPQTVDYIGHGEAKKKELKLRGLCKSLNEAGVSVPLDQFKEPTLWSPWSLDQYCVSGFDTALKDLDKQEFEILLTDLNDILQERLAITSEPAADNIPAFSGPGPITEAQMSALNKLCDLKDLKESDVCAEATEGNKSTFAELAEPEAGAAIHAITKM